MGNKKTTKKRTTRAVAPKAPRRKQAKAWKPDIFIISLLALVAFSFAYMISSYITLGSVTTINGVALNTEVIEQHLEEDFGIFVTTASFAKDFAVDTVKGTYIVSEFAFNEWRDSLKMTGQLAWAGVQDGASTFYAVAIKPNKVLTNGVESTNVLLAKMTEPAAKFGSIARRDVNSVQAYLEANSLPSTPNKPVLAAKTIPQPLEVPTLSQVSEDISWNTKTFLRNYYLSFEVPKKTVSIFSKVNYDYYYQAR